MGGDVVLHVGMVKAASTKLQRSLFPNHPQIRFLGKPHDLELGGHMVHALWADCDDYDERRLVRYRQEVVQPMKDATTGAIVISNEQLAQMERATRTMVASRMRSLFGECRIVIVIRNQFTWLESDYFWDFGKGNISQSFDEYLFQVWRGPQSVGGQARFLNYASLVESYEEVFGSGNIGVFLFEELSRDPRAFARDVYGFMGVDREIEVRDVSAKREMSRMSNIQYLRVKFGLAPHLALSRYLPSPVNAIVQRIGGRPVRAEYSDEWRDRVGDAYRLGNRAVAEKFRLPMDRHGYPL